MTTTAIILNLLMALVAIGGLAALVRLAHRLPRRAGAETIRLRRDEIQQELARAA